MKKVLVTGANSYIGCSFESYVKENYVELLSVDTVDMIDGSWRKKDFSQYDVIFHVAGLAHADVGNVSEEVKQKYYRINTDLAIETAKKAKADGVKQFVFMSSMIVYGGKEYITNDTKPQPANFYGDSKWQADKKLRELQCDEFCVTVIRSPMIYGKGSRGNYKILATFAKKLPIFPKINNKRSMLYIGNLCEFLCQIIMEPKAGVFFPQNKELVNTSDMVRQIAIVNGHKIWITSFLTPLVVIGMKVPGKIGRMCQKAFGSSCYELEMSECGIEYRIVSFMESIYETEM